VQEKRKNHKKRTSVLRCPLLFAEKVLTNVVTAVIIFKHVRESVGMVDKHV
jgi:hypothetical protein